MAKILFSDKNIIMLDKILSRLDYENSKNIENLILELKIRWSFI
ncbi:MAG: hypothetical protein Q4B36_03710 [Tissierellia bacterium]|nr:hypothetical protein [Tissierellia bacterium]